MDQVKPNTVIPPNFKWLGTRPGNPRNMPDNHGNRQPPYARGSTWNANRGRRGNDQREYDHGNHNSGRGNGQRNSGYDSQSVCHDNANQGNNGYHQFRHNNAMIVITAATLSKFGLTAKMTSTDVDPVWTIDTDCTRHVTYNEAWLTRTTPYTCWITIGRNN